MKNSSINKKRCLGASSILLLFLIISFLFGCGKSKTSIIGEYEFEDVIYVGGLSSATYDHLLKVKAGIKYSIETDSLKIIYKDNEEFFSGISYQKEKIDNSFIETNYSIEDPKIINFFNKYKKRYRYSLYNEQRDKIYYYIFLMDEEVFICKYAKNDILIFSIDKLKRINSEN